MPVKDAIHPLIKHALLKANWQITDDLYVISYGERFLFVDLEACPLPVKLIGIQQGEA